MNDFLRETFLWGGITLKPLLIAKLCGLGLAKRYPLLVTYLSFSLCRSILLLYLAKTGARLLGLSGYNLVWVITQPLLWALYFLLFLEFYSLTLDKFPSIRRLGRLVLFSGLAGITLVSCLMMILDRQAGLFQYPVLAYWALQERSVFFSLSLMMLLLISFASRYHLAISRNLWILCACFGGYFMLNAALLVLYHYSGDDFLVPRTLINGFLFLLALLAAVLFLSKAGEEISDPLNALWSERNEELERALVLRLHGFNQLLARVLKQ